MGAGIAGQCSRNRCLARWTPQIPHVAAEVQQVEQLEERPGHGPDPKFLCPTGEEPGEEWFPGRRKEFTQGPMEKEVSHQLPRGAGLTLLSLFVAVHAPDALAKAPGGPYRAGQRPRDLVRQRLWITTPLATGRNVFNDRASVFGRGQ
jgi:hypothetical protein